MMKKKTNCWRQNFQDEFHVEKKRFVSYRCL